MRTRMGRKEGRMLQLFWRCSNARRRFTTWQWPLSLALHRLIVIPMRPYGEHARPSPHADCRLKGVDQNGNRFPLPLTPLSQSDNGPHDNPLPPCSVSVGAARMILQNCIGIVFNSPFAHCKPHSLLRSPSRVLMGYLMCPPPLLLSPPARTFSLYDDQGTACFG